MRALSLLAWLAAGAALAGDGGPHGWEKPLDLRPTQMTVGMREVEIKRQRFLSMKTDEARDFLDKHPVPVVLGPQGRRYIVDHHHLVRAAWAAEVEEVRTERLADLSGLSEPEFWTRMKDKGWFYPYDAQGNGPHPFSDLPADVRGLADDPYRSLAWEAREKGAYEKTDHPYAEFAWAQFFRQHLRADPAKDFDAALREAIELASSPDASRLPGYVGR